jgi:hypothetical protein
MSITFTSHSRENVEKAIKDYGEHKRFVVLDVIVWSTEGNEYIVIHDQHIFPSSRTLRRLAAYDIDEYYISIGRHMSRDEREDAIQKSVKDYIVVDTRTGEIYA